VPPIDPGLVAVALIFGLPIVAVLTSHQQKMAAIIHGRNQGQNSGEMEAMRHEINELKQLIHQQTIVTDNLTQLVSKSALNQPVPAAKSTEYTSNFDSLTTR
jgi:HAMP domain-containing protein